MNWSPTKEALHCKPNSPCQHLRKHIENSMENMHADVRVLRVNNIFLLYKTNRFHDSMGLYSNRSQKISKCNDNISDTLGCPLCVTFWTRFDVICNLLLNRCTETWNLFDEVNLYCLPVNFMGSCWGTKTILKSVGWFDSKKELVENP